jgi:Ni/Co efflux regulator RcnB
MTPRKTSAYLLAAIVLGGATALAQPPHGGEPHGEAPHAEPHGGAPHGEPHPGPSGYQRVTEPKGWDARPKEFDRGAYQHNFQAARSFHVGAYRRPPGWAPHHWAYGQILPRAYWGPQFLLTDYWLFALEVPPVGYEWVRDDTDALLINTSNGEILQVEYGVFA